MAVDAPDFSKENRIVEYIESCGSSIDEERIVVECIMSNVYHIDLPAAC